MKKRVIIFCLVIFVFLANFVLSQENISDIHELANPNLSQENMTNITIEDEAINITAQKEATEAREQQILTSLKWLIIFAIVFVIIIFIGPSVFRKTRRCFRRLLLYILIFFIKHKKPDKNYIRDYLTKLGFKRKHVFDAVHRYEKKWGLKK